MTTAWLGIAGRGSGPGRGVAFGSAYKYPAASKTIITIRASDTQMQASYPAEASDDQISQCCLSAISKTVIVDCRDQGAKRPTMNNIGRSTRNHSGLMRLSKD